MGDWLCPEHGRFEEETGLMCPICGVPMWKQASRRVRSIRFVDQTDPTPSKKQVDRQREEQKLKSMQYRESRKVKPLGAFQ